MANTAYPPVIWVHFVILVAGRAFLDANPACTGTLRIAYKGNQISDPKIKLDCDIHLIRKFLADNQLPSDDYHFTDSSNEHNLSHQISPTENDL